MTAEESSIAKEASSPDAKSSPRAPEKLTLKWLYEHAPWQFYAWLAGALTAALGVGFAASEKLADWTPRASAERSALETDVRAAETASTSRIQPGSVSVAAPAEMFTEAQTSSETVRTIVLRGEWLERNKLSKTYRAAKDPQRKLIVDQIIDMLQSPNERDALAASTFLVGHLWFHDLSSADALRISTSFPPGVHPSSEVRASVASIFHMSYSTEVIPSIFGLLKRLAVDQENKVKSTALKNVGNIVYRSPTYIEEEVWSLLLSSWKIERDPGVRSSALASFKQYTYAERLKDRAPIISQAIDEALRTRQPELSRAALWVLGGGGFFRTSFKPTKDYEKRILDSVLLLYEHDRSIPRSWYVEAFKVLPGRLPQWASEQLSRDELQVLAEEDSRRNAISRMAEREQLTRRPTGSANQKGASAASR